MNKKLLIGILLPLILIILFFLFKPRNPVAPENVNDMMEKTETVSTTGEKSLKDLLGMTVPQQCTYKTSGEGFEGTGTVYISGGKMRGDFETSAEGNNFGSHVIVKDNVTYVWNDGQTTGFKTEYDPNTPIPTPEGGSMEGTSPDFDMKYSYDCDNWVVTASRFELPEGITFTSLNEMMEDLQDKMGDQCSVCEQLTGDSKTQCLQALNCD